MLQRLNLTALACEYYVVPVFAEDNWAAGLDPFDGAFLEEAPVGAEYDVDLTLSQSMNPWSAGEVQGVACWHE